MVGSLLEVKKYSQGRGKNTWVESRLIGLSPWGMRESWRWGSRVQTHKKLEVLFETEAGAAVMISEMLKRLCALSKLQRECCSYFRLFVKEIQEKKMIYNSVLLSLLLLPLMLLLLE